MIQSGAYGCIYRPKLNCDGSISKDVKERDNLVTKLQEDGHPARNEFRIGEKIRQITDYHLYFLPVEQSCSVTIKRNFKHIQECQAAKHGTRYVLLTMPYKKGDGIVRYLTNKGAKRREKLSIIFDVYKTLLNSVELLVAHRIVHYDLHTGNIHYHVDSGAPLLIDFGMSVDMDDITDEDFMIFGPDADWWCLDIHILSLWKTKDALRDFIDEHVPENHFFHRIFTPDEVEAYKRAAAAQVNRHMQLGKGDSVKELLSSWETWDHFSISVMMLKLLDELFGTDCRTNQILEAFVQLLRTNLHPDPKKRLSIDETKQRFNELFYTVDDPQVYIDMVRLFKEAA